MRETAQATLEMTAALILLMLFLVGATKIFMWLAGRVVHRQVVYENSRVSAADNTTWNVSVPDLSDVNLKGVQEPNETEEGNNESPYYYPALNVFK